MEPADLARWTRFASKGGIGKCTAICDCVAESSDDLMFLKDDEIIVLLQLPDVDGVFLGYCEGVVGKFLGKDVQFLTKLKKPVMAKRSSTASTNTGKSPTPPNSTGFKSPTPSHTPTPVPTPPIPSSSSFRSDSRSGSIGIKSPLDSPTTAMSAAGSGSRRSSLTKLSDSAEGVHRRGSGSGIGIGFPSHQQQKRAQQASIGSTASSGRRMDSYSIGKDDTDYSESGTPAMSSHLSSSTSSDSLVATPPMVSFSALANKDDAQEANEVGTEMETPSFILPVQPSTSGLSPPLSLSDTDINTIPLRIAKKSPSSPPPAPYSMLPPYPTFESSISTSVPDTSYSATFSHRVSLALSDGEVGIGLSLLQDLANGMEEDDDEDDDSWSRSSGEMASRRSSVGTNGNGDDVRRDNLSRSSEDETLDGLTYGDDDEADVQETLRPIPLAEPTQPLSPKKRFPSPSSLSPTSPSFPQDLVDGHERRPSLAASLAPSAGSSSSWEGAADIYDDYRYSRFSMASSKVSSHRSSMGTTNGSIPPIPDPYTTLEEQKRRERMNSDASVYTQGSRKSSFSREPPYTKPSLAALRPPPLTLVQENSPLLHTHWGSPISSTGFTSPDTSNLYTAVPGLVQPSSPGGVGMASAMRQRIEVERRSPLSPTFPNPTPAPPVIDSFPTGEGLGSGIVVEDDEELPSRILEQSDIRESPSSSPDLELMQQRRLAPLMIANRTPSPSVEGHDEDETQEGQDSGETEGESIELKAPILDSSLPPSPLVPSTPPIDPASPPSPKSTLLFSSPPSHLRPSLRDLREGSTVPIPGTNERRSLFLPHPNAPKAPLSSPGPLYVQQAQPHPSPSSQLYLNPTSQPQQGQSPPQQPRSRSTFTVVIRQALSAPPPAPRPIVGGRVPAPPRGPTIYGRMEGDFGTSFGPVPIVWTLEPPPTKVVAPPPKPGGPIVGKLAPQRGMTAPSSGPIKRPSVMNLREGLGSIEDTGGTTDKVVGEQAPNKGVIPRANFFPQAPGLRPRSRSFSGFNSASVTGESTGLGRSQEDPVIVENDLKKSLTASSSTSGLTSSLTPPSPPSLKTMPVKSSPLRPSPLSLPQNAVTNPLAPQIGTPILKSPSSPLAQSFTVPTVYASSPPSPAPSSPNLSISGSNGPMSGLGLHLRKLNSRSTLNESARPPSSSSSGPSTAPRPIPVSRSTLPPSLSPLNALDVISGTSPSLSLQSRGDDASSIQSWTGSSSETRSQLVTSPPPLGANTSASQAMSSGQSHINQPPVIGHNSLRTKLSLPNLRRNRSRQDEAISPIDAPPSTSVNPGLGMRLSPDLQPDSGSNDMLLQVQDMEFELVRPSLVQYQAAARTSEDSGILGRDGFLGTDSGSGFLRAESPAMSMNSGHRSPTVEASNSRGHIKGSSSGSGQGLTVTSGYGSVSASTSRLPTDSESDMDAHRNRELKWMSVLSTSPPSQARKLKKVKKLLLEGVPSSVRYLVWSHLTDGKARCVPGVYAQLCKRGNVPATVDIEQDLRSGWFLNDEQEHLSTLGEAGGGVVQLLQAYLSMVPDIQYSSGLPHIVGQLLILAPEEDAFWIFISIMDTHIRPYFSSGTTQMEVDSALFSRALEINDAAVAKKLLVDMGISPSSICAPWFSSLFVGCLPAEYLNRTWDLFLYEGIPFLIRVGLAIIAFVRRQLLESISEQAILGLLHHPPPISLPPTPENYISFVLSIKLKDDDVRKQRIKMEAQVKRQTQQQLPRTGATGSISLPRP